MQLVYMSIKKSSMIDLILHIAETFHHCTLNAYKLCLLLLPLHCATAAIQ
jgi:hypothetical protein